MTDPYDQGNDPLAAARGIIHGVLISTAVIATALLIWWATR